MVTNNLILSRHGSLTYIVLVDVIFPCLVWLMSCYRLLFTKWRCTSCFFRSRWLITSFFRIFNHWSPFSFTLKTCCYARFSLRCSSFFTSCGIETIRSCLSFICWAFPFCGQDIILISFLAFPVFLLWVTMLCLTDGNTCHGNLRCIIISSLRDFKHRILFACKYTCWLVQSSKLEVEISVWALRWHVWCENIMDRTSWSIKLRCCCSAFWGILSEYWNLA